MRVRKVDLDAIKLYESSQVKFKTTGTMREVQFSAGVIKAVNPEYFKSTYLDKTTGEIKERKHNKNCYKSPKSVRKLLLISYRVALKRKDNAKRPVYDRKWSRHTGSPKGKREQAKESQLIWYLQKYNAEEPDKHRYLTLRGCCRQWEPYLTE